LLPIICYRHKHCFAPRIPVVNGQVDTPQQQQDQQLEAHKDAWNLLMHIIEESSMEPAHHHRIWGIPLLTEQASKVFVSGGSSPSTEEGVKLPCSISRMRLSMHCPLVHPFLGFSGEKVWLHHEAFDKQHYPTMKNLTKMLSFHVKFPSWG